MKRRNRRNSFSSHTEHPKWRDWDAIMDFQIFCRDLANVPWRQRPRKWLPQPPATKKTSYGWEIIDN